MYQRSPYIVDSHPPPLLTRQVHVKHGLSPLLTRQVHVEQGLSFISIAVPLATTDPSSEIQSIQVGQHSPVAVYGVRQPPKS